VTRDRGFTLIELMIAGLLSAVVVFGAFLALTGLQRSGARQTEADEVVGRARVAMEIIARDVRSAGDSLDLLDTPCLDPADAHPDRTFQCPAILEPHPWRIVLARNAWTDHTGTKPALYRDDDLPPAANRVFATWPENVVLYQFVPYGTDPTTFTDGRIGYLGRIERVVNPFDFPRGTAAETARTTVLLENVLLDNRMREKPDGTEVDARYDHALFLFQVLTTKDKFVGDSAISGRNSSALDSAFLTPPMRFFPAEPPATLEKASPYMPDHPAEVVGLEKDATSHAALLATNSKGLRASEPESDLRLVLDRSLIRTVRIAFKVVGPERTDVTTGLDVDGEPANGTAPVYAFETTAELKALAQFTVP
jgi:type II secretory pathway pseudopilin PulG